MKASSLTLCRVAVISHELRIANIAYNLESHRRAIGEALDQGAQFMVFPELSLTGYTCSDLFYQDQLLHSAEHALSELAADIPSGIIVIVGVPIQFEGKLLKVEWFMPWFQKQSSLIIMNFMRLVGLFPAMFLSMAV